MRSNPRRTMGTALTSTCATSMRCCSLMYSHTSHICKLTITPCRCRVMNLWFNHRSHHLQQSQLHPVLLDALKLYPPEPAVLLRTLSPIPCQPSALTHLLTRTNPCPPTQIWTQTVLRHLLSPVVPAPRLGPATALWNPIATANSASTGNRTFGKSVAAWSATTTSSWSSLTWDRLSLWGTCSLGSRIRRVSSLGW
jgi:hypothetical protein